MLSLIPMKATRHHFDPFSLDRIFNEPFFSYFSEASRDWTPATDVVDAQNELVLTLEIPGAEEKDLHLNVEDRVLTVTGERSFEKKDDRDYLRSERWYGKFSRSFRLPSTADPDRISAELKNGVLTITVPKNEEAKPRQIEVKVN